MGVDGGLPQRRRSGVVGGVVGGLQYMSVAEWQIASGSAHDSLLQAAGGEQQQQQHYGGVAPGAAPPPAPPAVSSGAMVALDLAGCSLGPEDAMLLASVLLNNR